MMEILKYGQVPMEQIFARMEPKVDVSQAVRQIIGDVRARGDEAVLEYTARFDRATLTALEVSREEWDAAAAAVDPELLAILEEAAGNIRAFHSRQLTDGFTVERGGTVLGQKITALDRVGIYVPGGTAAYPSTVLMDAIPAKIAGVGQIIMVTPPGADGSLKPALLAAARIAGVDRVFKCGGAQAVAALAYGTASVPAVDKIVGPGNAYVAEAKRQVFGKVAIDMIAGPSEILVLSDGRSDPAHVAADLLSQAEHDRLASAVLVTDSEELALAVRAELERQLPLLPREEIARASLEANGRIILADSLERGVEIANALAPEHLELMVEEPFVWLEKVRHAGSVFLGRSCPEALGDYFAGPNHTLPTSGTARFSSPLGVEDFRKRTQFSWYSADAFAAVAKKIDRFAREEGLQAHGRSAMIRIREKE